MDIKTKALREYKELLQHTDAKKFFINGEVETITRMIKSTKMNTDFIEYIKSPGHSEDSMSASCPETGLNLKCWFDRLSDNYSYPLDVKSCCDATEHKLSQAFGKYYYHIHAAFYLYVLKLVTGRELNQFFCA